LRLAYSGELAAALAYAGHAKSVGDPIERTMRCVGTAISLFCRVGGWFCPMYGAGRLERRNIVEYEEAARAAHASGNEDMVEDLIDMAEVEWDHERYFREKAASHFLWRWFPKWTAPGTREEIRARFLDALECGRAPQGRRYSGPVRPASPAAPSRAPALVEPTPHR
jgi:hypothetical protein